MEGQSSVTDWLSLRDAAKQTRLARGWIEIMAQRNVIAKRINSAGQIEVRLDYVELHKLAFTDFSTLNERLRILLDGSWVKYVEIRAAIPSAKTADLRAELQQLIDDGVVEKGTYVCRGKEGKRYQVINVTTDR
jgi:hypothetical protein